MAAYDDCYVMYDLEKEFPGATPCELRGIRSDRHKAMTRKWDEEDRIKYEVPLDRCPTTGRTLVEEIKNHANQSVNPDVRVLDEKVDVSFVNEQTQRARARYHE